MCCGGSGRGRGCRRRCRCGWVNAEGLSAEGAEISEGKAPVVRLQEMCSRKPLAPCESGQSEEGIMLPDAIRFRLTASPFKPFVLKLASGTQYEVGHPELVSISPGGRHLILWVDENRYVDIDVLLVESVEQSSRRRRSA